MRQEVCIPPGCWDSRCALRECGCAEPGLRGQVRVHAAAATHHATRTERGETVWHGI
jgi:hypothetical protein